MLLNSQHKHGIIIYRTDKLAKLCCIFGDFSEKWSNFCKKQVVLMAVLAFLADLNLLTATIMI